jgi:hypothetical protein
MLCTGCFETSRPKTLLAGSDRVEVLAWLCFALPGWLYCAWRHALRTKACGVCGGTSLIREARAAAARDPQAALAPTPPVESLRGPLRWPHDLATPRERLHAGAPGVLAGVCCLLSALLAARAPGPGWLPALLLLGSLVLGSAWLVRHARQWQRTRACRAWLPDGREIQIELA